MTIEPAVIYESEVCVWDAVVPFQIKRMRT